MKHSHPANEKTIASMQSLEGLNEAAVKQIQARMNYKNFRKGDAILSSGQKSNAVFWIHVGSVKICSPLSADDLASTENRVTVFNVAGPGALLGEIHFVDGRGHSADVITLEKTSCFMMSHADFRFFLQELPELQDKFLVCLASHIRYKTKIISSLTYQTLAGSIAEQLLILAQRWSENSNQGHKRIIIPLTQVLLAQMTGHERSSVAHVLTTFKKKNWISIDKEHRITILNSEALSSFCR